MTTPSPVSPPAAGRLFRKAALDRLSTTEDLDQPATLASPRGRWWRLGLAVLCLTAAVGVLAASGWNHAAKWFPSAGPFGG